MALGIQARHDITKDPDSFHLYEYSVLILLECVLLVSSLMIL